MNNNSMNVPRLDREVDRALSQLDSVIEESIGKQNAFDSIIDVSLEYCEDLQDGEQDKSDEHYEPINTTDHAIETTDKMSEGDLTDQLKRQEEELEQMRHQETSASVIDEYDSPVDVMKMEFYIKRGNKQLGPFGGTKVIKNYKDGKVLPTDEISQDAIGPWVAFSDSILSHLI